MVPYAWVGTDMSDLGFAVFSEIEEGLLVGAKPSLWHFDFDSAIRFDTERAARTAANRRPASLARAVKIVMVDGQLGMELLADPQPKKGGWIIVVSDSQLPQKPFYVTRAGKFIDLSTKPQQAKGYRQEAKARQVAESLNASERFTSTVRQITAEILRFPS
jgi:hypothetical protein